MAVNTDTAFSRNCCFHLETWSSLRLWRRHSSACELSPRRASRTTSVLKLGGEGSSFSFRHRNSPFCEIVLYHNLGLEGGLNFRWQYSGKSPIQIAYDRIPIQEYDKNMDVQRKNIPMQNITDPTHIIGIYKIQSHYYAVISLFIGIDGHAPLYFVSLIGDINEIDTDCDVPEEVRIYNFRYLVKKEPQQESVTSRTIGITEGSSAYIITPVNDPNLIHRINMSKNSSTLLKNLELEYRRRT